MVQSPFLPAKLIIFLAAPIAMGYVETASSKKGTEISIKVRNKMQKAEVTPMPFVESRYYRVPE